MEEIDDDVDVGCDDCCDGVVNICFKYPSQRTLRSDWFYCRNCHPNSSSTASPEYGETEITLQEFNLLEAEGWRDDSGRI